MSFMAYELMKNPEVQKKLYEEIREMDRKLAGKRISYEQIQGMKYLDQTISEALRKWPAVPVIFSTLEFFCYLIFVPIHLGN